MKKVLVCRLAAFGDAFVTAPLLRYLKEQGNEVYVLTSETEGMEIFKHNPNITKLIPHKKDSIPCNKLDQYFESIRLAYECDRIIDLCESIECALALHPAQPQYGWTKQERRELCNHNYYDYTFEKAGFPRIKGRLPEIYFTEDEENDNAKFRQDLLGKFVILWCLSGSGLHKAYPYTSLVIDAILKKYPDVVFITVGDESCEILEVGLNSERVIHKSGKWSFRQSAIMAKYAGLVISPDTGMLHASGCFDTPKIGLLTHSTRENITKYFKNDHSIEAKVSCAPCFRLLFDTHVQCPIDPLTDSPWCMALGIDSDLIVERIEQVYQPKEAGAVYA